MPFSKKALYHQIESILKLEAKISFLRHLVNIIIVAWTFIISSNASAMSCNARVSLVLECKAKQCSGFFAMKSRTGNRCDTVLDISSAERIYKLRDQTSFNSQLSDGVFSIESDRVTAVGTRYMPACFLIDGEFISPNPKCPDSAFSVRKLQSTSLSEEMAQLAALSGQEKVQNNLFEVSVPVLLMFLLLLAFITKLWIRRVASGIALLFSLLILLGTFSGVYKTWQISAIVALLILAIRKIFFWNKNRDISRVNGA